MSPRLKKWWYWNGPSVVIAVGLFLTMYGSVIKRTPNGPWLWLYIPGMALMIGSTGMSFWRAFRAGRKPKCEVKGCKEFVTLVFRNSEDQHMTYLCPPHALEAIRRSDMTDEKKLKYMQSIADRMRERYEELVKGESV